MIYLFLNISTLTGATIIINCLTLKSSSKSSSIMQGTSPFGQCLLTALRPILLNLEGLSATWCCFLAFNNGSNREEIQKQEDPKCLKCRNSQVKSFSCPKPSWSSQTNYRLTKGAGSLTVIHLRDLGYEHLKNTWSSWWSCIAWSKSALLLELSWLAYSLLYFAPLAKSLGDKKVPDNGNCPSLLQKHNRTRP